MNSSWGLVGSSWALLSSSWALCLARYEGSRAMWYRVKKYWCHLHHPSERTLARYSQWVGFFLSSPPPALSEHLFFYLFFNDFGPSEGQQIAKTFTCQWKINIVELPCSSENKQGGSLSKLYDFGEKPDFAHTLWIQQEVCAKKNQYAPLQFFFIRVCETQFFFGMRNCSQVNPPMQWSLATI